MRDVILKAEDVCRKFEAGGQTIPVLNHVSLSIERGEFAVIMGASGAGKSTLLYALSGMDSITGGRVSYRGKSLEQLSEKGMAKLRAREFGFVFQQTCLVNNLTLLENVEVAGFLAGIPDAGKRAEELLDRMGAAHVMNHFPSQVSGGEAQRAAIARAVVGEPGLLFADEPTGALNRKNTQDVLELLTGLNEKGQTILMVTHDLRAALRGNRIFYLEDGEIRDMLCLPPYGEGGSMEEREKRLQEWMAPLSW